jgi:hypothetical protein
MQKKCKICNSKDRKVIEYLIESGAPRKEIFEKFGINRVNIFTHQFHKEFELPINTEVLPKRKLSFEEFRDSLPVEQRFNLEDSYAALEKEKTDVVDILQQKLKSIIRGSGRTAEEGLEDLIRMYGDKLRTKYDREKSGVREEDFKESDAVRAYKCVLNMNRS